jgi:hypothetical protein
MSGSIHLFLFASSLLEASGGGGGALVVYVLDAVLTL